MSVINNPQFINNEAVLAEDEDGEMTLSVDKRRKFFFNIGDACQGPLDKGELKHLGEQLIRLAGE